MPSRSIKGRMSSNVSRHMISPRMTQKSEPPSSNSSARFGTMRVVWIRSGFRPRLLFSLSSWRIHSSKSCTVSQPTESLMRCSVMFSLFFFADSPDNHDFRAFRHLGTRFGRNFRNDAVERRTQCMLHFHRLDDGDAMALGDVFPNFNEQGQHLAVHWYLDDAVALELPHVHCFEIPEPDDCLPAAAQHI